MRAPSFDSGAFVPGPVCEREPSGAGPLDGLRLAVKDLINVGGAITGGGNPDWAASHAPALHDAPCVAALRAAGARVVGKTLTDELAFSLEGENGFYGTPRHPLDPDRLPGGSSSGSAAAVAWREADLALGTDTGGSVRVPASFCGVFAMRPTHGRVPLEGVLPFAPSYDTVGWFARDADLLRCAGRVLLNSPSAAAAAPLKLRVARDVLALCDEPVRDALLGWAQKAGITQEAQAFSGDWRAWLEAYSTLQGLEIQTQLGAWIRWQRPTFSPAIAPRFAHALALDPALFEPWRLWRENAVVGLAQRLPVAEAWLIPAAPCVALARDADNDERSRFYERALAMGAFAGHAGLPQITLPLASAGGLPVAVSFIAARGQDEQLLDLAVALAPPGSSG